VEHSIAVVDPGQDKTTSKCLCQFRSQQMSNVSDGLCMVTARSRHRRDSWDSMRPSSNYFGLLMELLLLYAKR